VVSSTSTYSSQCTGATHFLTKRLPKVATEMALHVLAYNLTRVMNILALAAKRFDTAKTHKRHARL
jgi:hypothetical protein